MKDVLLFESAWGGWIEALKARDGAVSRNQVRGANLRVSKARIRLFRVCGQLGIAIPTFQKS